MDVAQAKADVELCCPALPLNSRGHTQTCESQKPALLSPACAALQNCVRITVWRRQKQTQNCAALLYLATRADILKRVKHRNLRCSALAWAALPASQCAPGLRAQLKPDGTQWRTGWEVKGKLANGVGSQYSHTTTERGVSSITTADAHNSAASSRLNWRPRRIRWTRPFRRKTKSGLCACAITFQTQSTYSVRSIPALSGTPRNRHNVLLTVRWRLSDWFMLPAKNMRRRWRGCESDGGPEHTKHENLFRGGGVGVSRWIPLVQ